MESWVSSLSHLLGRSVVLWKTADPCRYIVVANTWIFAWRVQFRTSTWSYFYWLCFGVVFLQFILSRSYGSRDSLAEITTITSKNYGRFSLSSRYIGLGSVVIGSRSHQRRLIILFLSAFAYGPSDRPEGWRRLIGSRPRNSLFLNCQLSYSSNKAASFFVFLQHFFSSVFVSTWIAQNSNNLGRRSLRIFHGSSWYFSGLVRRVMVWTWILVDWEEHGFSFFGFYVIKSVVAGGFSLLANVIKLGLWFFNLLRNYSFRLWETVLSGSVEVDCVVLGRRRKFSLLSMRRRPISSPKMILSSTSTHKYLLNLTL